MANSYDLNALSGINAASGGLSVISNNLANAESVGFKGSRAEFSDLFNGAQNSAGSGVKLDSVTQDFGQGTLSNTGRELDMSISGEGFFILEDSSGRNDSIYSRNGSFKMDKDGFLTSQSGDKVKGFLLNEGASSIGNTVFESTLSTIELDDLANNPKPTTQANIVLNLDGQTESNINPRATSTNLGSVGSGPSLLALTDPALALAAGNEYPTAPDFSTNEVMYDSLGGEHRLSANYYYRGVVEPNSHPTQPSTEDFNNDGTIDKYSSWIVQYTVEDYNEEKNSWVTSGREDTDGDGVINGANEGNTGIIFELRFDSNGELKRVYEPDNKNIPNGGTVVTSPTTGADIFSELTNWSQAANNTMAMNWKIDNTGSTDPISVNLDMSGTTMHAGSFKIEEISQDGYSAGELIGLSTGSNGIIQARYSNGQSISVAQVALADFSDNNGLEKLGEQGYAQTFASGEPKIGSAEKQGLGSIHSGSLEYSNVDVASELVKMIQTQRTYQASAQVISTSQQLTQTILNL
jgi:flagellar hook protein FlgE